MSEPLASLVAERLAAIHRRVGAVAGGRHVDVLAVTKGFGPDAIAAAASAGCTAIGENYAQELLSKAHVARTSGVAVHFIGRLQSNKVRQLAELVDVWESVDRPSLVDELARRAPAAQILVQVNATGEADKGGCRPDDVTTLVGRAREAGLHVDGLMTVGPTSRPAEDARAGFASVRRLADELGLSTCSMGMTADLEVAVEEGATQVRVGTALFGVREVDKRVR